MFEVQVTPVHIVYAENSPKQRDKQEYALTFGVSTHRFKSKREATRVARAIERAVQQVIEK